jgi:two-component system LytT family response regulator
VKLRTLIVDDEPLARRRLRRLLRAAPCIELVAECGDGLSAVAAVERERPDLLLLDIQMPELDGFAVLEALPSGHRPVTVFVTAYDSFAIRAFEASALDYLLKPIDQARLIKAVGRAEEQVRLLRQGSAGQEPAIADLLREIRARRAHVDYLLVRERSCIVPVRVEDIDWVEARGKYVRLHVGTEAHLLRDGLNQVEAKLDPGRFVRVHRSTLVNVRCIKALEPGFHGDSVVHLRDGTELALSRSHRARLYALFGEPG